MQIDDTIWFYQTILELLNESGHISAPVPVFKNHSSENFVFFDTPKDGGLTKAQRLMFSMFDHVSLLAIVEHRRNGSRISGKTEYISLNLKCIESERSIAAFEIHHLLHPLLDVNSSVCIFKCEESFMFSIMGYGFSCYFSDWFPLDGNYFEVLERLDISNFNTDSALSYFLDFIYMLARKYYTQPTGNEVALARFLPYDYFLYKPDEVDDEAVNEIIRNGLYESFYIYGDDYIGDIKVTNASAAPDFSSELEMMLLDFEEDDFVEDDEENKQFEEDLESDEDYGRKDEDEEDETNDEYEFEDIDPEIFDDPVLMVKYLQNQDKTE